jgi:type I restriction enzyme M protein
MLDQTTKRKIDSVRDILVGKVPDPKAQVEQITTALVYKFMDDMDKESQELGGETKFFSNGFEKYAWTKLMDNKLSGQERLDLYVQAITNMSKNPHIPQLFRDIFKGAFLPYNDPRTLSLFLKEINEFTYDHSEDLGDAFEYLLSILGSQGDAGQFRTPRHIIDFIVAVVDPKKNETILDPACGTAGFLISAYKHILKTNQEKPLTPDEKLKLMNNLAGYDISPDMVKLALVNLYLHGSSDPKIHEYDTLTSEQRWDDTFDVILANPPFMTPKGGIHPHKRFSVQANRSEVLFVDYIAEHLTIKGRAGIIVPEGIIFQSANAYKALRKNLIENWGLYAVVSLPSGVFQPYSGVKTSILLLDKEFSKKVNEILFIKVQNDGYDLGAQRRPIDKNDLPKVLEILRAWKRGEKKESEMALWVKKRKIAESGDYNLTGERYKEVEHFTHQKWPMVELGEVCEIQSGSRQRGGALNEGIPSIGGEQINADGTIKLEKMKYISADHFVSMKKGILKNGDVLIVKDGATTGKVGYYSGQFEKAAVNEHVFILRTNEKILPYFLFKIVQSKKFSNDLQKFVKGIIGGISLEIKKLKIPLPPLEVQKEIVEQIEAKQRAIDAAKAVIENLERERRYFGDKVKKLEGVEWVELGEVCEELFAGGDAPKQYSKEKTNEFKFPILSNGKDEKSLYGYAKGARVFKPSITISARGTIGYSAIQTEPYLPIVRLIVAIPNERIELKFFKYILDTIDIYNNGNSIPQLTIPMIKNHKIPLPPLDIQKQLVAEMEEKGEIIKANKKLIKIMEREIGEVISNI